MATQIIKDCHKPGQSNNQQHQQQQQFNVFDFVVISNVDLAPLLNPD